jgi:hypothetical protein
LQEARRKRDDARVQLAGGQDPLLQRRIAKVVSSQLDHQHTFEAVARQWLLFASHPGIRSTPALCGNALSSMSIAPVLNELLNCADLVPVMRQT